MQAFAKSNQSSSSKISQNCLLGIHEFEFDRGRSNRKDVVKEAFCCFLCFCGLEGQRYGGPYMVVMFCFLLSEIVFILGIPIAFAGGDERKLWQWMVLIPLVSLHCYTLVLSLYKDVSQYFFFFFSCCCVLWVFSFFFFLFSCMYAK